MEDVPQPSWHQPLWHIWVFTSLYCSDHSCTLVFIHGTPICFPSIILPLSILSPLPVPVMSDIQWVCIWQAAIHHLMVPVLYHVTVSSPGVCGPCRWYVYMSSVSFESPNHNHHAVIKGPILCHMITVPLGTTHGIFASFCGPCSHCLQCLHYSCTQGDKWGSM